LAGSKWCWWEFSNPNMARAPPPPSCRSQTQRWQEQWEGPHLVSKGLQ
jgi:hypothetical protein